MIEDSAYCFPSYCIESLSHKCIFVQDYKNKHFVEGLKKRVTELLKENHDLLLNGACKTCVYEVNRLQELVRFKAENYEESKR